MSVQNHDGAIRNSSNTQLSQTSSARADSNNLSSFFSRVFEFLFRSTSTSSSSLAGRNISTNPTIGAPTAPIQGIANRAGVSSPVTLNMEFENLDVSERGDYLSKALDSGKKDLVKSILLTDPVISDTDRAKLIEKTLSNNDFDTYRLLVNGDPLKFVFSKIDSMDKTLLNCMTNTKDALNSDQKAIIMMHALKTDNKKLFFSVFDNSLSIPSQYREFIKDTAFEKN